MAERERDALVEAVYRAAWDHHFMHQAEDEARVRDYVNWQVTVDTAIGGATTGRGGTLLIRRRKAESGFIIDEEGS